MWRGFACVVATCALRLVSAGSEWRQVGVELNGAADGDCFGRALAISSDGLRMVAAAVKDEGHYVRVYDVNDGSFAQVGNDIKLADQFARFGWAVDISGDGNVVAVSKPMFPATLHMYEYSEVTQNWNQRGTEVSEEHGFGYPAAVSLSHDGSRFAYGATNNHDSFQKAGHVRVYEYSVSNGQWSQLGADIDGTAAFDESGAYVDLSADGDTIAIGAAFNDGGGISSGQVRIFAFSGGQWTQRGNDVYGTESSNLGPVALSSDGLCFVSGATGSGAAMAYQWSSGQWQQKGGDFGGFLPTDLFGSRVTMDNACTRIAIAAPGTVRNASVVGSGRAYEYHEDKGWVQLGQSLFGKAGEENEVIVDVAISSNGRMIIGAPADTATPGACNDPSHHAGSIQVYDLYQWTTTTTTTTGTHTSTTFSSTTFSTTTQTQSTVTGTSTTSTSSSTNTSTATNTTTQTTQTTTPGFFMDSAPSPTSSMLRLVILGFLAAFSS